MTLAIASLRKALATRLASIWLEMQMLADMINGVAGFGKGHLTPLALE